MGLQVSRRGDAPQCDCASRRGDAPQCDCARRGFRNLSRRFVAVTKHWLLPAAFLFTACQSAPTEEAPPVAISADEQISVLAKDEQSSVLAKDELSAERMAAQPIETVPSLPADPSLQPVIKTPEIHASYNVSPALAIGSGGASNGTSCTSEQDCASGFCIDNVCCDTACGHGVDDCQACSTAKGAAQNGVCGFSASGTVCRNANGTCDIVETCTGTSTECPVDQLKINGAMCRPANGFCDVAETCNGTTAQCPSDNFATAGTVCRNANGTCDIVETCTGTSTECPIDKLKTAGATCRPANGFCDVAETCNGTTAQCPFDNFAAAGTVCRNANGTCDIVETCTGTSTQCPPDTIKTVGTVCRNAAGPCDVAESCNGLSVLCPVDKTQPAGVVCRNSNGFCDVAEACTGTSAQCPADVFKPAGTMCRNPNNHCDVAETCTGSSAPCPPDAFAPAGTVCRNANGACDIVETCTGTSTLCPPDTIKTAGTVCRNAAGACDVAESCNGLSVLCPVDNIQPAGVVCRNSNGFCDVAEACTGTNTQCPANVFKPAGTMCRNPDNHCDVAETCTGSSAPCPPDAFAPAGTVCRNANGGCDAVETCTGTNTLCPPDQLKSAGSLCRASAGACDLAETCSGNTVQCPPDSIAPQGVVCRTATSACDLPEACSGTSLSCPTDTFAAAGTVCRPSQDECDQEEVCSGAVATCPADAPSECCPSPPACDASITISPTSASLFLSRSAAATATFLDTSFKLSTVLTAILNQANVPGQTPENLYRRIWDTQRTSANGAFSEPFAPHCNDSGSTINGFAQDCPRNEGNLATGLPDSQFRPVALINRFDLAPTDGSHCGEYRIIYSMFGQPGRVFLIFEAQLPNPTPECGIEACRPVAEFWRSLPTLTPANMNASLQSFYFAGLPGFRPVIHPQNYGFAGTSGPSGGQIRANMFHSNINWQLREFHLERGCVGTTCNLFALPVSDKNNPFGNLFNSNSTLPLADSFQEEFLEHVPSLAASTLNGISMNIPDQFNTGQSTSFNLGAPDSYLAAFAAGGGNGSAFGQQIQSKLTSIGSTLTPTNIIARALTQSCAGCHDLSIGDNLGGGITFPFSLGFVHFNENGAISPALSGTFLPHRANVLSEYLQACNSPPPPPPPSITTLTPQTTSILPASNAPVPTLGGSVTH